MPRTCFGDLQTADCKSVGIHVATVHAPRPEQRTQRQRGDLTLALAGSPCPFTGGLSLFVCYPGTQTG